MSLAVNNPAHKIDVDGTGRLSDSDNSSSGHTSEDDEENEGSDDGHPIMSIFASYYGIEDTPIQDNKPKGTIDDAGFQPEIYVKVTATLLQSIFMIKPLFTHFSFSYPAEFIS